MERTDSSRSFFIVMNKIISKKVSICVLSFVIMSCFLVNSCLSVYATTSSDFSIDCHDEKKTWQEIFKEFCDEVNNQFCFYACQIGCIATLNFEQFQNNFNTFIDNMFNDDGSINPEVVTYDETTDTITMDVSELITTLSGQLGLKIYPGYDKGDKYKNSVFSAFGGKEDFFAYYHLGHNGSSSEILRDFYIYYVDLNDYYVVANSFPSNQYKFYNRNTLELDENAVTCKVYELNTSVSLNFSDPVSEESSYMFNNNVYGLVYCYIHPFSYWNSATDLMRYVDSSMYLGSSFGQNKTITIPVSDLNKDWEKAYNDILDELNGIKEATGERPTQKQIDDAIDKISSKLDDIGSNIGDVNGNLGDIGDDVEDIAKTLDDLYKLMEDCKEYLKDISEIDITKLEEILEKIREAIDDAGGMNSEDLTGVKEFLSGIQSVLIDIKSGMAVKDNYKEVLDKIYSLMENMYKLQKIGIALDVADLLIEFVELIDDDDTSVIDSICISLANVANASKEHFPTSLPWDLIVVFALLRADPVVPHYEIPFSIPSLGIDEVMVIDLSEFEQLSRASRTFLSVLFVLLLIHLTRKMTATDESHS